MSSTGERLAAIACPVTPGAAGRISLGHGTGGRLSHRLLEETVLPAFVCPESARGEDQAVLPFGGGRLAFTTDAFVVSPLFFPGGDIGRLAVFGTVNDLAVGGARPRWISLAMVLEEGLPLATLERVLASVGAAAREAGVSVVTGDTKVVGKGHGDGIYLATSGIGEVPEGRDFGAHRLRAGDAVLVSGTLADHGLAVLGAREDLGLPDSVRSDAAPLHGLVEAILASGVEVHAMRDPTRGGLAATLTEWSARAGLALEVEEGRIPLAGPVRGACEILGLDPLHVANEGKLVVTVPEAASEAALTAMRSHPLGTAAVRVGRVQAGSGVTVVTASGGRRCLELPTIDLLPRIC